MARTTKERLDQMDRSRRKNDRAMRKFIDRDVFSIFDCREWAHEHIRERIAQFAVSNHPEAPTHLAHYERELYNIENGVRDWWAE